MGSAGWTRYATPGSGFLERLDVRSLCLIRETLGRYHALADFAFAMQGLGCGPISLFGSEEQRQRCLVPASRGEKLAAWTKDRAAERATRKASMAKLYATEAAQRVIDAAVQLHGGHGVIVESLYRDVRAIRIYEGASEVQQTIIAKQTLA